MIVHIRNIYLEFGILEIRCDICRSKSCERTIQIGPWEITELADTILIQ